MTKQFSTRRIFRTGARRALTAGALLFALGAGPASADDRVDHFRGEPAATVTQAFANLTEYGQRLQQRLDGEVTPQDLAAIHELTYTLENALEKLAAELSAAAAILEEVHVASETADRDTVKTRGRAYLEAVDAITARGKQDDGND